MDKGRVVVVSASVGAGHDGPADELARRLRAGGWRVDQLDGMRASPQRIGSWLRDLYFFQLRVLPRCWERTLAAVGGDGWRARVVHAWLDAVAPRLHELLPSDADVVVSTYPLVGQLLGRLRLAGHISCPVMTYATDMAVHPLWVHPGVDHVLAIHEAAAARARELGAQRVTPCVPAVAPAFSAPACRSSRLDTRRRWTIPADALVALVTSGSEGIGEVVDTARDLDGVGVHPVVLCGRNAALLRRVERSRIGTALGWTDDVAALLAASDLVVQNAGGLASLEALAAGRPLISYRVLPGHGEANARVLDAVGLAPWVRNPESLRSTVTRLVARDHAGHQAPSRQSSGLDPAAHIADVARIARASTHAAPAPTGEERTLV